MTKYKRLKSGDSEIGKKILRNKKIDDLKDVDMPHEVRTLKTRKKVIAVESDFEELGRKRKMK